MAPWFQEIMISWLHDLMKVHGFMKSWFHDFFTLRNFMILLSETQLPLRKPLNMNAWLHPLLSPRHRCFFWKLPRSMFSWCKQLKPLWRPFKSPLLKRPCTVTLCTMIVRSRHHVFTTFLRVATLLLTSALTLKPAFQYSRSSFREAKRCNYGWALFLRKENFGQ